MVSPDNMQPNRFTETDVRVFTTNPDTPETGHTFIWADARWYERESGPWGATAFRPLPESEDDLRIRLQEEGLDLEELDDEFARGVRNEFKDNAPLYPEAPELSNQPPHPDEAELWNQPNRQPPAEGGETF